MPAFTNASQRIPPLFKAIMENHDELESILTSIRAGTATEEDWRRVSFLKRQMREYRRQAEKVLCWNTDKGNTAK